MSSDVKFEPFLVKDCALLNTATGKRARNLKEMRDHLQNIPLGSIYNHFWGRLLRHRFDEPEYNNDFAEWIRYFLQDGILAERLAIINPVAFADLESLRQELIEVIEQRLDETELITWAEIDMQFHFVGSQIIVFDTRQTIEQPEQLAEAFSKISLGSLYYHFIDARRRSPEMIDDFRSWLTTCGDPYYDYLSSQLALVDPYFVSLQELRAQLIDVATHCFQGVS